MRHRAGAGMAVLLAGLCVAPTQATPRSCPQVMDPAGDVRLVHDPVVPSRSSPELDIRSIEVSSTTRSMTAVIRVSDLAERSVEAASGARWEVHFFPSASSEMLALWADRSVDGTFRFAAGYGQPYAPHRVTIGAVPGVVDLVRSEIRITAALDVFEPVASLRKGTRLEALQGLSRRFLMPNGPVGSDADYTDARTHRIGTSSCNE